MSAIPLDQASRLRAMMRTPHASTCGTWVSPVVLPATATPRTARVIAVASGKGGVGKTNVAVNLAILLARKGLKATLVDADLGTANVDVLLNVQSKWDLSHLVKRQKRVEEVVLDIEPGLRLVAGASGLAGVTDLSPAQRESLIRDLARLEHDCDVMIVDCGAGISQNVLAFASAADELLVVTTPEPTAMTDAYALVKVLTHAGSPPRIGLVVNQALSLREGEAIASRVASTAERFLGIRILAAGQILRDENVALAVRQRVPFVVRYPRSPASGCLATLAGRVARACRPTESRAGFFDRLMSFFC